MRKPDLPSTAHDTGQGPRTPPRAAAKSSPARSPSLLASARPRPRRIAGQLLSLHLDDLGAPGVPISHRGAGRPPEQGRCALHRARGGGAHRAGPWAAAGAGAGRLQGVAAKHGRARCAIFPRLCRARRRPALQPRAGTYTWHRARQSRWSSARAARRSARRCATPPRPFRPTAKSQNFTLIDSTNRGHPLIPKKSWYEFPQVLIWQTPLAGRKPIQAASGSRMHTASAKCIWIGQLLTGVLFFFGSLLCGVL
jgi:hypothetical protein